MSDSSEARVETDRQLRASRLRLAVGTSIPSKLITAGIQLVAVPIAANALGAEGFGVYAVLAAALSWVTVGNLGIGPGLTLRLAGSDGEEEQRRLLSTAFFFVGSLATGVLLLLLLLPQVVPLISLFGPKYEPRSSDLEVGFFILSLVLSANILLSVAEAARLGLQQQHLNNLWGMLGNGLSLVSILLVAAFEPTVPAFLAAVFVPGVLCRALNMGSLLVREEPHLRPALQSFSRKTLRHLVGPSLGFLTVQVAVLLYQQVIVLEVGRMLGPEGVAPFALMLQLVSLFGGMVVMIMLPLWPALADAKASRDSSWIRAAYKRVTVANMGYAAVVAVAFAVASDLFLRLVFGFEAGASDYLPVLFAFYFVLTIWEYTNINFLFGLSMVWTAAIGNLARGLVAVVLTPILVAWAGIGGAPMAMCISVVVVTMWFFPSAVRHGIRQIREKP